MIGRYSYSYSSTSTRTHAIIKYSDSDSHILQVLVLVLVNLVLGPALRQIWRNCQNWWLYPTDRAQTLLPPVQWHQLSLPVVPSVNVAYSAHHRDQAPVPLTVFRSNLEFDQNLECSRLKYAQPITRKFCTHHDSYRYTVETCAKFRSDP